MVLFMQSDHQFARCVDMGITHTVGLFFVTDHVFKFRAFNLRAIDLEANLRVNMVERRVH